MGRKIVNNKSVEELEEDFEDDEGDNQKEFQNQVQEEPQEEVQEETKAKRGMTLKSIPISMKKARKVIDDIIDGRSKGTVTITPDDKFDLSLLCMYADLLREKAEGILQSLKKQN